jgi:Flp pilus assembly protein TadD
MRRPVESRANIAEARKADAASGASYTAEALLLDFEGKVDDARVAYAKAVELNTSSAYAHYRLASLKWQPRPSQELLRELDALLLKALDRNVRYAAAYAWLGEIRASLGQDGGEGLVRRAISLEPMDPGHRMRAAYVLLRQGKPADARIEAQNALTLADDDDGRREAQALLDRIAKAGAGQQ